MGKLKDFIENLFGVKTEAVIDPEITQILTTRTLLFRQNPNRLGVLVVNLSAVPCYISPDERPSATHGIQLAANGGSASLTARDDFELVGYEWYGIAIGANADIFSYEILAR